MIAHHVKTGHIEMAFDMCEGIMRWRTESSRSIKILGRQFWKGNILHLHILSFKGPPKTCSSPPEQASRIWSPSIFGGSHTTPFWAFVAQRPWHVLEWTHYKLGEVFDEKMQNHNKLGECPDQKQFGCCLLISKPLRNLWKQHMSKYSHVCKFIKMSNGTSQLTLCRAEFKKDGR
jgi:hypothetical protein